MTMLEAFFIGTLFGLVEMMIAILIGWGIAVMLDKKDEKKRRSA